MSRKLVSPLARRLVDAHQLDLAPITGTGPRGRVMSCDVRRAMEAPHNKPPVHPSPSSPGKTSVAADLLPQTRPVKEGYYVYDCSVNMFALASLSRPIAVQCDKLLDQRYSLMDYILRAVVKACVSHDFPQKNSLDLLLFEGAGAQLCALKDVAEKTLYQLARLVQRGGDPLDSIQPQIVVCDALITREQVAPYIDHEDAPLFGFVTRGEAHKVGIRVGCEVKSMELAYTFYVSTRLPAEQADGVAARLRNLLHDPVSLLLIS